MCNDLRRVDNNYVVKKRKQIRARSNVVNSGESNGFFCRAKFSSGIEEVMRVESRCFGENSAVDCADRQSDYGFPTVFLYKSSAFIPLKKRIFH